MRSIPIIQGQRDHCGVWSSCLDRSPKPSAPMRTVNKLTSKASMAIRARESAVGRRPRTSCTWDYSHDPSTCAPLAVYTCVLRPLKGVNFVIVTPWAAIIVVDGWLAVFKPTKLPDIACQSPPCHHKPPANSQSPNSFTY